MPITKVLAVAPVRDLDAAITWYTSLLGRGPDARPMDSLADWHVNEGAWVQVFHDPGRAGHTALNFAVEDLAAERTVLAGRGIGLGEEVVTDKGARLASVDDPSGNTVTLIENPSV
ncbi:VOC family protein [Streptomyces sp. NPDC048182]|uniref:VOC family protein n=1 Tax=Streptomyces sp. NPDC048182 TaxID=3365507 RepID=UPI00371FDC47